MSAAPVFEDDPFEEPPEWLHAAADKADPLLEAEDDFFDATPVLGMIRQAARSKLVSPWAVTGSILARIVAEVPPHVTLPPVIGSDASLNLAIALVATSGQGKSGSAGCADDLLGLTFPRAVPIGAGTGEGIMSTFLEFDKEAKKNVLTSTPLAFMYADEVGQIGAVQARSGSTFGPIIRTMITGGAVSTTNAEETRRRHLPAHSYRLCIVSGVQPRLSDVLLADEDAGTPQRWVWLPALDPFMPDEEPEWPGTLGWELPRMPAPDHDGRVRIAIPDEVRKTIRDSHRARQRGDGKALDGHKLLTQEKVAAAIALLHGDVRVTMFWWDLAGTLMEVSTLTRAVCEKALADKADGERREAGRLDVVRDLGAREARADLVEKAAVLLWKTVVNPHHPNSAHSELGCTRRCLTFALRKKKGMDPDVVIAEATEMEWIVRRDGRWYPGASQPANQ